MQQSILKFIALSYRHCSTCFGHYYAHHQEPFQTAIAASGFHVNEVGVFPAMIGLLVGRQTTNPKCLDQIWGPTQHPVPWVLGVKQPGYEADHLPPFSAKFNHMAPELSVLSYLQKTGI
jgi:hypothetical protein